MKKITFLLTTLLLTTLFSLAQNENSTNDSFYDEILIDPAEGEVESLQNFTITFPAYVGEIKSGAVPTLVNKTTGTTTKGEMTDVGLRVIAYFPDAITEPGSYELTIPEGSIIIYSLGEDVKELVFKYEIKKTENKDVITEQPDGELRIYSRSGKIRRLFEEGESEDDYVAEVRTEEQEGFINIVFADNNVVYLQQPVAASVYDGWIKGSLSDDGRQIRVPTGQLIAYTHSFDMGVQVNFVKYNEHTDTYLTDSEAKEIVYDIDDNGVIRLTGTSEDYLLGAVNRAFGESFSYLDGEWIGGDFDSAYTLTDEQTVTVPDNLSQQELYALSAVYEENIWSPYLSTVRLGFDGNNAYLQGITDLLPDAWIKGTRDADNSHIVFASGQFLGTYTGIPLYLWVTKADAEGNITVTDLILSDNGDGTYTSYNDIFINTSKTNLSFVTYYQGLSLQPERDAVAEVPADMEAKAYTLTYKDESGQEGSATVKLAFSGSDVYLQGATSILPDAWLKGTLAGNKVEFKAPQFFGRFIDEEEGIDYPIYFQAFSTETGDLYSSITYDYDATTGVLSNPSAAFCAGINKTSLLILQDFYDTLFTPSTTEAVTAMTNDNATVTVYFDLQGRRAGANAKGLLLKQTRRADGSLQTTKVVR